MTEAQLYSLDVLLAKYAKEISNKTYFVQVKKVTTKDDFEECIILKLYHINKTLNNNCFIDKEDYIQYFYKRDIAFSDLETELQKLVKQKVFELIMDEEI